MEVGEIMTKNSAPLIITIDKVSKEALFEKAEHSGSTVSQIMRDLVRGVLDGDAVPVLRIQILHPLKPGSYSFVPMNEAEINV